jgi:hypothetical protein
VHRHEQAQKASGKFVMAEINQAVVDEGTVSASDADAAYERVLPELQALSPGELIPINLDIPSMVTTTLGALPEIRALRPDIEKNLQTFDLAAFDKLEDYALALKSANGRYLSTLIPSDELKTLVEEAAEVRETLVLDATALARRGILDSSQLRELRGPVGYKNLSTDLETLANALRGSWAKVQGQSAVKLAELTRASNLSTELLRVVGLREQGPGAVSAAADIRVRAFTLLSRTYDAARRAVMYLRWSFNDVDGIAPSLYAGRSNGRRKESGDGGVVAAPASPGGPATATNPPVAVPVVVQGAGPNDGPWVTE